MLVHGIPLKNVDVGWDIGLTLFRRQAIDRTSDDINQRCMYAAPELNFYITLIYDSRMIYLYTCIYFIEYFMNVTLLVLYVYLFHQCP